MTHVQYGGQLQDMDDRVVTAARKYARSRGTTIVKAAHQPDGSFR